MNLELFRKNFESQSFEQKLNNRIERLQRAELNPVDKTSILLEIQDDPIAFINLFGVVYEPRTPETPDVPFFLFPYQEEVIRRIIDAEARGSDLLIEKTRDMGITWTVIWYMLWRWLTRDKWYGLMGSRKEEEVDNKSPQSLFGKMRYALYSLPNWIRPQKFHKSEHDIFMKLVNPDKTSYIDGESANPNFGRGKRTSMVYLDELFFWKFARESWRSCIDTSQVRIGVSTAYPSSFARGLRDSFESQGKLITLDWHSHPFKDEAWFQAEKIRREADPLAIEGELEISYRVDPTNAYYPEVLNCPIKDTGYNQLLPLYIGMDFGSKDNTAFSYWQRDSVNYYCIDAIEKHNKPLYWYYPFLKQGCDFKDKEEYQLENRFTKETFTLKKKDYLLNELELIKRFNEWNAPVMYCGEVAHRQTLIKSNTSISQELAGVGIFLRINDKGFEHIVRRTATKKMLTKTIFSGSGGALEVFDALSNSHYSKQRENSVSDKSIDKPVHDEWADLRSSVENFAVNIIQSGGGIKEHTYRKFPH